MSKGTWGDGVRVPTWKFHGREMDGSSTGSGAGKGSELAEWLESAVFGVFGRLPKEENLKRPLRELADSEKLEVVEYGETVMRLGA